MSNQKAPNFDEVGARLDKLFATNFTIPSVRELKAACGGKGSLSTYQTYLNRWVEDRRNASGTTAILLAIKAERNAHASVMSLLLTRLEQHMLAFPAGLDLVDDDDDVERDEATGEDRSLASQDPRSRTVGAADDGAPVPSDACDASTAFADIASRSEARFMDDDDVIVPGARFDQRPATHGPARQDRSAYMSTDRDSQLAKNTSLSRADGGGQQAALPLGTNQPAPGESDTAGGSTHGNA